MTAASPTRRGFTFTAIRGSSGRLQVGYQVAARLGAWTLTPVDPEAWSLTAGVVDSDPYWLTQRPLELVLEVGRQHWHWRLEPTTVNATHVAGRVVGQPIRT
jgi:hypothetical protein